MRITIKDTDNQETVLAAHGRESVSNYRLAPSRDAQVQSRVNAKYRSVRARGNLCHTITFDVHRELATLQAAQALVHDHAQALPQTGTVQIQFDDALTNRWLNANDVQVTSIAMRGVTVDISYRIQAGQFLIQEPTS